VTTFTVAPSEPGFLDTNLLVYPYDRSEPEKQRRAHAVLTRLAAAQAGVVSAQVLAEFFVAVTRKCGPQPACTRSRSFSARTSATAPKSTASGL